MLKHNNKLSTAPENKASASAAGTDVSSATNAEMKCATTFRKPNGIYAFSVLMYEALKTAAAAPDDKNVCRLKVEGRFNTQSFKRKLQGWGVQISSLKFFDAVGKSVGSYDTLSADIMQISIKDQQTLPDVTEHLSTHGKSILSGKKRKRLPENATAANMTLSTSSADASTTANAEMQCATTFRKPDSMQAFFVLMYEALKTAAAAPDDKNVCRLKVEGRFSTQPFKTKLQRWGAQISSLKFFDAVGKSVKSDNGLRADIIQISITEQQSLPDVSEHLSKQGKSALSRLQPLKSASASASSAAPAGDAALGVGSAATDPAKDKTKSKISRNKKFSASHSSSSEDGKKSEAKPKEKPAKASSSAASVSAINPDLQAFRDLKKLEVTASVEELRYYVSYYKELKATQDRITQEDWNDWKELKNIKFITQVNAGAIPAKSEGLASAVVAAQSVSNSAVAPTANSVAAFASSACSAPVITSSTAAMFASLGVPPAARNPAPLTYPAPPVYPILFPASSTAVALAALPSTSGNGAAYPVAQSMQPQSQQNTQAVSTPAPAAPALRRTNSCR